MFPHFPIRFQCFLVFPFRLLLLFHVSGPLSNRNRGQVPGGDNTNFRECHAPPLFPTPSPYPYPWPCFLSPIPIHHSVFITSNSQHHWPYIYTPTPGTRPILWYWTFTLLLVPRTPHPSSCGLCERGDRRCFCPSCTSPTVEPSPKLVFLIWRALPPFFSTVFLFFFRRLAPAQGSDLSKCQRLRWRGSQFF